jgi:hypothetical protein
MLLSQQPHVLEKSRSCCGKVLRTLLLRTLLLRTPRTAVRTAASLKDEGLHASSLSPSRKKIQKKYPFVTTKKKCGEFAP